MPAWSTSTCTARLFTKCRRAEQFLLFSLPAAFDLLRVQAREAPTSKLNCPKSESHACSHGLGIFWVKDVALDVGFKWRRSHHVCKCFWLNQETRSDKLLQSMNRVEQFRRFSSRGVHVCCHRETHTMHAANPHPFHLACSRCMHCIT